MREFVNQNSGNNGGVRPSWDQVQERQFRGANQPGNGRFSGPDKPGILSRIFGFVPKLFNSKKKLIIWVIVVLAALGVWGGLRLKNRNNPENQPQVYEALVNIVDQKTSDPVEDARSSLKKGDVIAYFPEGHSWSDTEKNSYLIVKIKLTSEEAAKLTQAKTKEVKKEKEKGPDGKEIDMGPEMETVLAREYFLDLPGYDVQKFWSTQEQPFKDKVFDDGVIEKK